MQVLHLKAPSFRLGSRLLQLHPSFDSLRELYYYIIILQLMSQLLLLFLYRVEIGQQERGL